jgi:uncharacterized membrane protein YkoI
MKTHLVVLAFGAFAALPLAAQSTTAAVATPHSTTAAHVDIKVSKSLAHSVKVSGDSAMAIARANADWGEVSSAELKMMDKRLVYDVKVLNKSKRATDVAVDAMSGEIIKNKQYGGLKATVVHKDENKKLLNAKRDSAAKAPND